jgi:Clp amino terminal domain, pathogenicity island component/UvrB/uvrC motif
MISLNIADLVVVAGRTLGLNTGDVLDMLDVAAAEAALAEATGQAGRTETGPESGPEASAAPGPAGAGRAAAGARPGHDAAAAGACLLHALIRHRPLRRGNDQVAVMAMIQFLAVNGWQADLDPAEATSAVVAAVAAGEMPAAGLVAWLWPRLLPDGAADDPEPSAQEAPMRGWRPGRRRNPRNKGVFQRFTVRARDAVVAAQQEARAMRHGYIGTEHLLLGLLREGDGVAGRALASLGIALPAVREQVEEIIGLGKHTPTGHIPFTPRAKKVLELSLREAMRLDHLYIGTEHILLGLLREGDGVAVAVLTKLGAGSDQIRHAVIDLLSPHGPAPADRVQPPGLHRYDERIALVRLQKDAAIDAQDFDQAAALRDSEKRLLAERAQRIADWSAGVDVAALGEEVDRLRREVSRLQNLLLQHGVAPSEGGEQTA